MIQEWTAHQWVGPVSHHAEGPLWDPRHEALFWVDQYAGLIRSAEYGPAGARERPNVELGEPVGAIVPAARGGWMLALGNGFAHLDEEGTVTQVSDVAIDDGVRRRMNDGKCDPHGRFWAGSMAFDKTPEAGSLYVLERGDVSLALGGRTISNGMAWTPDGRVMYYIDTPTRRIDRLLMDSEGGLTSDGHLVKIVDGAGNPDGMCIDDEGAIWVALWGGSAIHRYSPDGELVGVVHVDAPQVSSCAFGGPERDVLFVTTSREDYTAAQQRQHPRAGAIFAVRPGVTGPAATPYE